MEFLANAAEEESPVRPPKKSSGGYRANRKSFFLTYPKCPVPLDAIREQLARHGELTKYLIASETHASGDLHRHAYIVYKEKKNFKDPRWADLEVDGVAYHPNDGGAVRSESCVTKYVTKDGDFITNFYNIKDNPFTEALAATTAEAGMEILCAKRPREYLLNYDKLFSTLKRLKPVAAPVLFDFKDFNTELLDETTLHEKAVLFYGPTGIGKTRFALAHFQKPLLVRHLDELKKFSPGYHDGIVFDDMSFAHFPTNTVIHLVDMDLDSPVHCRFSNAVIPAGTPRIFTFNTDNPFYDEHDPKVKDEQIAAIKRRVVRCHFEEKLFQ